MRTSFKLLAVGSLAALAAVGAATASAETTDGSDFHPLQMNSPVNPDVQAGAMAAARPSGTEPVGQSTSAPAMGDSRAMHSAGTVSAIGTQYSAPGIVWK